MSEHWNGRIALIQGDITTLAVDAIVNAANPALLGGCYRNSLALAEQHELRSIAFPAISTGVYGYPLALATRVAQTTVRDCLQDTASLERVVFCCFSAGDLAVYEHVAGEVLVSVGGSAP